MNYRTLQWTETNNKRGDAMVTIQELSKRCGVSVSTVSKALNGYVDISERTKKMVLKTAREMGYFPNANARALKMKKTYNIGVLFHTQTNFGFRNDYFAFVFSTFREVIAKKGYDVTFIEHNIGNQNMTYLEHCNYRNFDGVCIINARYDEKELRDLIAADMPCITIDYPFQETCSVVSDNYNGMVKLVQSVIDKGHRKIAYIFGEDCYVTSVRKKAYIDTLEKNKIEIKPEYLVEGMYRRVDIVERNVHKLLSLKEIPTCILAPDDVTATGVANAIYKSSLENDISIAGFDGLYPCYVFGKRLTTIQQNTEVIGRTAANELIEMIEHNQIEFENPSMISCDYYEGESVIDIRK